MNKYEEIEKAYEKFVTDGITYRDKIHLFATRLTIGFRDYLSIPAHQFLVVPVGGEYDETKRYSPQGAVNPNDDGWWQIGCIVVLGEATHSRKLRTTFSFFLGQQEVKVRIGDSDEVLSLGLEEDLGHVFDATHSRVLDYFENYIDRFIEEYSPQSTRSIGFV